MGYSGLRKGISMTALFRRTNRWLTGLAVLLGITILLWVVACKKSQEVIPEDRTRSAVPKEVVLHDQDLETLAYYINKDKESADASLNLIYKMVGLTVTTLLGGLIYVVRSQDKTNKLLANQVQEMLLDIAVIKTTLNIDNPHHPPHHLKPSKESESDD